MNIVVWRRQAENCANHLSKGRLIALDGRIQSRSYEDSEGKRRNFVEVVADNVKFLDWPSDNRKNSSGSSSEFNDNNESTSKDYSKDSTDDFGLGGEDYKVEDDDVPF